MQIEEVSGYRFAPEDLDVAARRPGISAFMRTRNGADFIEATIRSHVAHYDEIVVVYNQCKDATADILARLSTEFSPKIRVFHYLDRVQPLGSKGHAQTPGDHPESMVNYSNFALAQTRHQIAVKLDDDHLAIGGAVAALCARLRAGQGDDGHLHCFSGLNLARGDRGQLAIPAVDPVSGGGDIGYFRVSPSTRFFHDRRFERFGRAGLERRFSGFLYWHLKFLKQGAGFRNYELADNPQSRFARKKERYEESAFWTLPQAVAALRPGLRDSLTARVNGKARLTWARDKALAATFGDQSLEAALDSTSPGWRAVIRLPGGAHGDT